MTIDSGTTAGTGGAPGGGAAGGGAAGARPPDLRGLLRDLDRMPERMAAIVAATDGIAQGRTGPVRFAVIADPGLCRALLTRPTGTSQGRGIQVLRLTLGRGLLTSNGDLHRRQRRLVQPAFHPGRLARYATDAVRAAQLRSARWRDGQQVDLAEEMSSLTLEIVGRTIFGTDLTGDSEVVSRAQGDLLRLFPRLLRPAGLVAAHLPTPLRRRMRRDVALLDGVVERVVAARHRTGDTGDMVSMLLAARDEETGAGMPARQIRDEVLTLLLAGHETTAVTLSWAWFALGRHPQVRAALHAEVDSPQATEALAEGHWDRLPYTRAVVAETLRLYPAAHITSRVTTEDVELGGHLLRKGTVALVSPYGLHRDPRSWGGEVLVWRPERWLDGEGRYDESAPGQPRGAYLPFGAGARICIGAAFATMEAVLVLARLARDWDAELPAGFEPGLQPLVTLRPRHGVPATLRTRRADVPAG